jgi:uncharacterized protein
MSDIVLEHEKAIALFDAYKGMLTSVQRELFSDYYLYDLSLSEIAENRSISRAAASDGIKKSLQKMEECEEKLGILVYRESLKKALQSFEDASSESEKEKALASLKEIINHGI